MTAPLNRQFLLAQRPVGLPSRETFSYVETSVGEPGPGQILVKNAYLSLDPAMRGWMNDAKSYIPPVGIGEVMRALGVGELVASQHPDFAVGDHVNGALGVQDYFLGEPKGCRVVGIAGGADKCKFLVDELGFDGAIDYKNEDVIAGLKRECPKGVDVYFDNVGGDILDAVLTRLAFKARVVICGAISQYNNKQAVKGPANYLNLLVNSARMEGMVVMTYAPRFAEAAAEIGGWLASGQLKSKEDIVEGLETFPETLLKLFSGENFGKLVLKVE